jgi:spermidine synthase
MFGQKENVVKFSIFILGLSAIVTQIIALREFLSALYGNELVIGIVLANWMLLTGLGAYIGRYIEKDRINILLISLLQALISFLPLVILYLLYYLKDFFLLPGQIPNILEVIFGSFLLLAPYCIISGLIFTLICHYLANYFSQNTVSKVYAIEAFGSVIGGFLFNFLFLFVFKTFVTLKVIMLLNFIAAILLLSLTKRKTIFYGFTVLFVLISIAFVWINFERMVLNINYPDQQVLLNKSTPYGNLVVTKKADQVNFYDNGIPIFSSNEVINIEESVHYAMLQHPDPKNVLLISGGFSGVLSEIAKYDIEAIDYVEINPAITEAGKEYTDNLSGVEGLNIIHEDGRLFLKKTEKKYDVVLLNIPDPSTIELNRYYTVEFFEELKERLNRFGVVSTRLATSNVYLTEEALQMHASLYSTLQLLFHKVILIPGEKNYFLASDGSLRLSIVELQKSRNIPTSYVNQNYLNDDLIKSRSEFLMNDIRDKILINYDFQPVFHLLQLKYWLDKIKLGSLWPFLLLIIPLIIFFIRASKINLGLFTTGFSAAALEIIILISFQIIYGYVFQMIGIIIMLFMMGLGVGAYFMFNKINVNIKIYSLVQYLIGIFAIVVSIIFFLIYPQLNVIITHSIFTVMILFTGIITGLQFSFATRLNKDQTILIAAKNYSSDLLGSAIGALLVVTFLIPYLGIYKVCLLIGILNFIVGLIILVRK